MSPKRSQLVEYVPPPSEPEEELVSLMMAYEPNTYKRSSLTRIIEDVLDELKPRGVTFVVGP